MQPWQEKITGDFLNLYSQQNLSTDESIHVDVMLNPSVVATIKSSEKQHHLVIYSGLLQSPRLTAGAFAMTLCHEVAHLVAGPPYFQKPMDLSYQDSYSSEGQSDYYAAMVCFKQLFKTSKTLRELIHKKTSKTLNNLCQKAHPGKDQEQETCEATAQAGYDLLTLVHDFPIAFTTPAQEVPSSILINIYPSRQCRLDTILAGALCDESLPLDLRGVTMNYCLRFEARRPDCWYPRQPLISERHDNNNFS